MTYDFGFPGAPILFSWPSDGSLLRYIADREDAEPADQLGAGLGRHQRDPPAHFDQVSGRLRSSSDAQKRLSRHHERDWFEKHAADQCHGQAGAPAKSLPDDQSRGPLVQFIEEKNVGPAEIVL